MGLPPPKPRPNLLGRVFAHLTVIEDIRLPDGRPAWKCRCECGSARTAFTGQLTAGEVTSCGCKGRERNRLGVIKHGQSNGPNGRQKEYRTWAKMIGRCHTTTDKSYCNYGGRGIEVCEQWRSDFRNFLADVGPAPTPKHSIDRINNDGNYEPGNVRWATSKEQSKNTRRTVRINGRPLVEICEELGLNPDTVRLRLKRGLSPDEALARGKI